MQAIREYFRNFIQDSYKFRLRSKGAEMVEYALVLACICAVGALVYMVHKGTSYAYFKVYVGHLWEYIGISIKTAL